MVLHRPLTAGAVAIGLSALALAVGLAAGGYALANGSSPPGQGGTVEINATGTAIGAPDTLTVQLAVTTMDRSAAAALNNNDTEMHHLQAVFIGAGVKAKDLQTSNLSVSPTYNDNGMITGYGAEDDLSATLHALKRAGGVIDAAENAVGNDVQINGINFSLSNNDALMQKARIAAMQNAKQQASDFTRGAGESVGGVVRITTSTPTPPPIPFGNAAAISGTPRAAPVPIRAGTENVSVSVDVVFALS